MVRVLLLISVWLSCAFALTYYGFPSPFPNPTVAPTWLSRQQWVGNVDWSKFNVNFTAKVPLDLVGCDSSRIALASPGQILVASQVNLPCDFYVQQRTAQDMGYNGILGATPLSQLLTNYLSVPGTYPNGIPLVYSGYSSQATVGDQIAFPASLVALQLAAKGLNVTILLDLPSREPLYDSFTSISGALYNIRWIGYSYATFALVLCSAKLAVFITTAGRIELSIPQLVLFCCALGSIFVIMDALWAIFGLYETAANLGGKFFEYWPFSWSLTVCIIVGFYFGEIAQLTSSGSLKFLSKLIIPFIAIVALLWACQIVISFLTTYPVSASSVTGFGNLFISIISFVDACTLVIVIWGSVALLRSTSGITESRRNIVILTVILSGFATAISVSLSIAYRKVFLFFINSNTNNSKLP